MKEEVMKEKKEEFSARNGLHGIGMRELKKVEQELAPFFSINGAINTEIVVGSVKHELTRFSSDGSRAQVVALFEYEDGTAVSMTRHLVRHWSGKYVGFVPDEEKKLAAIAANIIVAEAACRAFKRFSARQAEIERATKAKKISGAELYKAADELEGLRVSFESAKEAVEKTQKEYPIIVVYGGVVWTPPEKKSETKYEKLHKEFAPKPKKEKGGRPEKNKK